MSFFGDRLADSILKVISENRGPNERVKLFVLPTSINWFTHSRSVIFKNYICIELVSFYISEYCSFEETFKCLHEVYMTAMNCYRLNLSKQ